MTIVLENKSQTVLGYAAWLVEQDYFKRVIVSFLIPGHTHTDIDQMHSTWEIWLQKNDCNTPQVLIQRIGDIYKETATRPTVAFLEQCFDFKAWLNNDDDPFVRIFEHHSKIRAFKFEKQNNTTMCWVKSTWTFDSH